MLQSSRKLTETKLIISQLGPRIPQKYLKLLPDAPRNFHALCLDMLQEPIANPCRMHVMRSAQ